jgi:predicted alpha/beta-hydrolase family hydrolase
LAATAVYNETLVIRELIDDSAGPRVRGYLHVATKDNSEGLVLTHGASANCQSRLLVALSGAFAEAGFTVLRCDLPFRQQRPHGPPFPGGAEADREGLKRAVEVLKKTVSGRIFLGGHSYGGRQATMLAADETKNPLVAGLLLLAYPLHPPRKPEQLRTAHFPKLTTPALFVHGSRDPFGSQEEMQSALKLIPAPCKLMEAPGAGHELLDKKAGDEWAAHIVGGFCEFFGS